MDKEKYRPIQPFQPPYPQPWFPAPYPPAPGIFPGEPDPDIEVPPGEFERSVRAHVKELYLLGKEIDSQTHLHHLELHRQVC